jgi:hypothetical protein
MFRNRRPRTLVVMAKRPPDTAFLDIAQRASATLEHLPPPARGDASTPPARQLFVAFAVALALLASVGGAVAAAASPPRKCEPVHYVVNLGRGPAAGLASIEEAFARTTQATGIVFVYDGPSAAAPSPAYRGPQVLVAWVAGADLVRWTEDRDVVGTTRPGASIYLNADRDLPLGFADRRSWGGVLMHEAGHLVGLAHTPTVTEIMYPDVVAGPAQWGAGDRLALQQAGLQAGCQPNTPLR